MRMDRRRMLGISAASVATLPSIVARAQETPPAVPAPPNSGTATARGNRAAVATVHPLATAVALKMLADGGNAADAAVAAGLMLAVVDGHNSGLGGGCFILARQADGRILAIDGRETAPAAAHRTMFFRDGVPDPRLSQFGPLASGVPGALAAYHALSEQMGTGRWATAAREAAEVARDGFELSPAYAARLHSVASELAEFPSSRAIFLDPQGHPWKAGDRLLQNDLARTLDEIALDGPRAFYDGRFAELTERWMREHGGLITADDLRQYRPQDRSAVRTTFHDHEIIGFPPPSSGGIHVAQILALVERFDLPALLHNEPASFYHVIAEAMRLAFADRAEFLGDPMFAEVPLGLIDAAYLHKRSELISLERRIPIVTAGAPPGIGRDLFGRRPQHTTHFTAADANGNWVAITATINTTFGSKAVIPGTGVVLNNQMDDFAIAPGVPNAFGLVGAEANAPAPLKRPLSSMSPTIVLRGNRPVLTCGAAGGPRIISATAQMILRFLALEAEVDQAIAAPRIHHQWLPDQLWVEEQLDATIIADLERRGHTIRQVDAIATAQAIARRPDGMFIAAAEPRLPGFAGALAEP